MESLPRTSPKEEQESEMSGGALRMQSTPTLTLQPSSAVSAVAATPITSALAAKRPDSPPPPGQQAPSVEALPVSPTLAQLAAEGEEAAVTERQQDRGRLSGLRSPWRVVEVGLAVLLAVLVIALVWVRRQS
jgi:hypothetical protein